MILHFRMYKSNFALKTAKILVRLVFNLANNWYISFSRISRNFSREMGQIFSHLARNQKREKCAGLIVTHSTSKAGVDPFRLKR